MSSACKTCGGPRTPPKQLLAPASEYERDPFCSRECCQLHHGVVHPGSVFGMGGGTVGYRKPVAA